MPETPETAEIPPIISLHRYFCAAARMRDEYTRVLLSPEHEEKKRTLEAWMLGVYLHSGPPAVLYYWYGALFVVKEGYDELKLSHSQVDALLSVRANVEALRRCRNGVFHFQKTYFDERFLGLMQQPNFVRWVHDLTDAFRQCIEREMSVG
jgi:hypothetical protein